MLYTKPRGTEDLFDSDAEKSNSLIGVLNTLAKYNGYKMIQTPIFESSNLYVRSVGNTSDIVQKEFYSFMDKGNREMVLRPEGTAGVIRAIIENKLLFTEPLPLKVCYSGPMFRYERPQSGRLRQFTQFGVECIGTDNIYDDIDVFMFAYSLISIIGLKQIEININNIGSIESRSKWIKELKKYFLPYKDQLSETSQNRININPLRILDDKIDGKKDFVKNAPMIDAFLTEKEKKDFEMICSVLKKLNVNFKIDKTLVRGLDYYSNFVFEFNSTCKELEGQPTLVGGGRYANLIKELSGKQDYSSIGFAVGIERIIIAANIEKIEIAEKQNIEVLVTNLSESTRFVSTCILQALRNKCISSVCNFDIIKLTKAFSYAKSINAMFIVIIGKKELENNEVIVKNQKTFKQTNVKIDDLIDFLKEEIKNYKNR